MVVPKLLSVLESNVMIAIHGLVHLIRMAPMAQRDMCVYLTLAVPLPTGKALTMMEVMIITTKTIAVLMLTD